MASLKAILLPKSDKKGNKTHRLALRVTVNRKRSYLFLGYIIDPKDWNADTEKVKRSHPKAMQINRLLRKKYDELEDYILESRALRKDLSAKQITEFVKGDKKGITFFQLSEQFLKELNDAGNITREVSDRSRFNMFKEFIKHDVSFREIDEAMLRKFRAWLLGTREVSERTVMNYFVAIRTLFNRAITDGIVDQKYYPFGKGKVRIKFPQTIKVGLEANEIISIEDLNLKEGTGIWHARNAFLFSFYFAGIRVSDVLRMKWQDIKNDRLYYKMGKNSKVDSLKIPEKVSDILKHYKEKNCKKDDYIFPELKKADTKDKKDLHRKIKTANKKFNNYLKQIGKLAGIDKPMSMHIARHSFGNIAGDKVSPQMLQKLYRHTSLTTTIGYQGNFIHKDADDALDKIVNF